MMPQAMKSDSSADTPMFRQYREIKGQCPDAILFYRVGDFYEMFYEDAVVASKVLDIVLTFRNKNDPNPIPFCGVPYHSMQPYLAKLVEKGHKVAICDQVEDPKAAKGVVRREVTRVVTPGLSGALEEGTKKGTASYLAAVHSANERWGISLLDISTGDFRVTEILGDLRSLQEEVRRIDPREIIVSESFDDEVANLKSIACLTRLPAWVWDEAYARKILYGQFGVATLSGFQCEGIPAAVIAAGAALHYARETQRVERLPNLIALRRYDRSETMVLSEESRRNLSMDELVDLIDRTKTSMGRRTLTDWFCSPLIRREGIERRLDAVEELSRHPTLMERLSKSLEGVYDIERINSRLSLGTANARDLRALADTLKVLGEIKPVLGELKSFEFCGEGGIYSGWDGFSELREEIARTLVDDPPFPLKEGGLVRDGVRPDVDELRRLRSDAKGAIAAIEERERRRTGISSLKVRFNRVFGYYLEVTTAHLAKVPPDFIRKQTLANAERYITPELKEFEDKILGAEERLKGLEYEIFCELRDRALLAVPALQAQAGRVGRLDSLLSLAVYARENRTVRPKIEESGVLEIRQGRHPLVESALPSGSFVPNDLSMNTASDRFLMITGPNMAGKSTVIRQTGVIVLMAQVGSFVPADEAKIGIVDRIFTRVGASDRLARGESTFMVEMCETASILHHATDRSLILLDEIGRGTSTFDGISIAWAVAEYLHDRVRARTLFATHYHELIDLALTRPGIKNFNVQVKQQGDEVTFLYRLAPGGMSHSFGIHVARLAGLPMEVVERAKEVLKNLEQEELTPEGSPRIGKKRKKDEKQTTLF